MHKVRPTVYYSYHFVISSYHKSYQQYLDILLYYKKLEIYYYKKKENKQATEIYSKESNNPYMV